MVNRKKIKVAKAAKKAAEPTKPPPNTLPRRQGLTPAQLTALIFLFLGISYVIEYGRAVHDSKACAAYFVDGVEACSPADVALIMVKYYEAITCLVRCHIVLPRVNAVY